MKSANKEKAKHKAKELDNLVALREYFAQAHLLKQEKNYISKAAVLE